ncbi:MAG: phosphoribosylformylglycinamidine synthase subunit PurQ, partial [Glaciecola sp.]
GIDIDISALGSHAAKVLFSEEVGVVVQVANTELSSVETILAEHGLSDMCFAIGQPSSDDAITIRHNNKVVLSNSRTHYRMQWASTTFAMQSLRDNPACAAQEHEGKLDANNPGLHAKLSFDINEDISAPYIIKGLRPKMAILREQGVNSHVEMAAAFNRAGFDAVDVHMSDLVNQRKVLNDYAGLVACGGFSYGDVLGAGEGWAKSILYNAQLREMFAAFFANPNTFSLGVCNGCQMLSNLKTLIPGAENWPHFVQNQSARFEARAAMVEVQASKSIFLQGMQGSRMPIAVSHGEGRAEFASADIAHAANAGANVALRYVDNYGKVTEQYPANPNGSMQGITGLTSNDGRATIMMPHPERVFRAVANSWRDPQWQEDSPWMRMFRNARVFLD